jgi:hypothetical protein
MSARLCIDLCSGLGGFSQAFVDAGWDVVRVDNNPTFKDVPHTIIGNILTMDWTELARRKPFVVVASPPCERFSIANSSWPQRGIRKGLDIVGACLEAVIDLKPQYWCLENPKGRLRWFLGAPPHSVKLSDYGHNRTIQGGKSRRPFKPTDLWGNIPFALLEASKEVKPLKEPISGWSKEERARRAEMPYGLSKAILSAVEEPVKSGVPQP